MPNLSPSGGFENIVTGMDVFSRCLFAYPRSKQDTKAIAKVAIKIMTKHLYLPMTPISDKGPAPLSHVIKQVAGVHGMTLNHATTKQAQSIGMLERSHASTIQASEVETAEQISLWHKYLRIAVLNYNTSYHAIIGCEPSRLFHGRIPYNVLDLKKGVRRKKMPAPNSHNAQNILE